MAARETVGVGGKGNKAPLPEVDGSILEGGGQVLRVTLACSALLGRPLHIHSIRAHRSRPGLSHQHSTGVKLVADVCSGQVWPSAVQYGGHCAGESDLRLWPGVRGLHGGSFVADTHTAGAVTLLLQAVLPAALLAGHSDAVSMVLKGGTNVAFSPPVEFMTQVLFRLLVSKFNVPQECLSLRLLRRGFYPRGGGEVAVKVLPVRRKLRAITMLDRGTPVRIDAVVFAGGTGRRAKKDCASALVTSLRDRFGCDVAIDVRISNDDGVRPVEAAAVSAAAALGGSSSQAAGTAAGGASLGARSGGLTLKQRQAIADARRARHEGVCGCLIVLRTTTGCLIPGDSMVQHGGAMASTGRIDGRTVAGTAVGRLMEAWEAGGCVCEHTMDQLIIFMAMAEGTSRVLCPGKSSISSQHLATAVHFCQLLTGATITVTPRPDLTPAGKPTCSIVECKGIGFLGKV